MTRLLFVHAHPDDETIATGVAIAHHAARGDDVLVVTCTLGDEGEIIPADQAHVAADPDALAAHRRTELAEATARLGARYAVLGEQPDGRARYRDSGMAGTAAIRHPRAFAREDPDRAGSLLVQVLRDERPDLVVTYDVGGGYGHPDHVQTRRVVEAALSALAHRDRPEYLFEIRTPSSWARQDRRWLAEHVPDEAALHVPGLDEPYPVAVVADGEITHWIADSAARERQAWALAAHRTQVRVFEAGFFALSNEVAHRLSGREAFVRLDPATGQRIEPRGTPWRDGLLPGAG